MRTLTPIFSILIAILLYFFFIGPRYAEVKEIRAEAENYQEAARRYDEFATALNRLLDLKRQQSPSTLERINQLVPHELDTAHIIADLEQLAEGHQLLFGNITTESLEVAPARSQANGSEQLSGESTELQTADISFELVGTYGQFKEFLRDLESSLTLLEVTGLRFKASDGLFEQFGVTVRAYALPRTTN